MTGDAGEAVEEGILRSEHDRRAQHGRRPERPRAPPARRPACCGRTGSGCRRPSRSPTSAPARRHAGRGREPRDAAGALGMDTHEVAGTRFRQDADQVDHDVGAFHRLGDARLVGERRVERHHLADTAHRPQLVGASRTPDRHAHHVPLLRQPLHHVAAEEAGAAEHCRNTAGRHQGLDPTVVGLCVGGTIPPALRLHHYRTPRHPSTAATACLAQPAGGGSAG